MSAEDTLKYQLEEIADWYAASKIQSGNPAGFPDFSSWYEMNRQRFVDHPSKPLSANVDSYIRTKLTR